MVGQKIDDVRAAINALSEDERIPGLCAVCGSYGYEPICNSCTQLVFAHCTYGDA
jgi:hypothetical protein